MDTYTAQRKTGHVNPDYPFDLYRDGRLLKSCVSEKELIERGVPVPPPFNITAADLPAPTVAAVLADPSVSFALKDTLRAWLDRDALDAYNDAALLVELLRARAEVQPKEDAHTTGLRLAVQDAACILNELKAGNPQRTRAVYWLENNASLLA